MRSCLKSNYGIELIGLIKISEKVYKVKTNNQFFALKYVDEKMAVNVKHIKSLHLQCFVTVIKNNQERYLTKLGNQFFILMPWLEYDEGIIKELKLKNYYQLIAYLHQNSFYECKVTNHFFEKQINDIQQSLQQSSNYYEEIMESFEQILIKSPSNWFFIMHFHQIQKILQKAYEYFENYQKSIQQLDRIRVCLNYHNFSYQHIYMIDQVLISIDHLEINYCIYDIYTLYQKNPELICEMDLFGKDYMQQIQLLDYEKYLLATLLCIVPIVNLSYYENDNIIHLTRLLYQLESIEQFLSYLAID